MKHEDILPYLQTLLPEDYLRFDELTNWKFGPPIKRSSPDPRIGIGDLVRLTPVHPTGGFPPHQIDHFQLLYLYSGSLTICAGEETAELYEGNAVLIAPGFVRSVKPCRAADCGVLISMEPALLREHMEFGDLASFSEFLNLKSKEGAYRPTRPFLRFDTAQWPDVRWYMNELCCEHFEPDRRTYLVFPALLNLLLIGLDRCADSASRNRGSATPQTVLAVCRYIKTNHASATLVATADRFGFSPNHLSHILKQATGMSFSALRQNARLAQSAHMLETTRLSVSEIAAAVGMGNVTRFYAAFSERFGMTPAQYRANFQEGS